MSEAKKPRKTPEMGPRGFLHKANTNAKLSAEGFIAAHRVWLETGEVAPLVSPILRKLDTREILPTPGLSQIMNVVMGHIMAEEIRKGEEKMARDASKPATTKPWLATVYTEADEIATRKTDEGEVEDLQKGFQFAQEADRWADRRLNDGEPGWYAIVSHTSLTVGGTPLSTVIYRQDAIARMNPKARTPFMKTTAKSAGKLSFGVKAGNTRVHFSKG